MRRTSLFGVAAAAALVLSACGGSDDAATESTDAGTTEETTTETVDVVEGELEPLNIHIVAAKTGIISPFDIQPGESFTMAVEEINAAGGVGGQQVSLVWNDTQSDPALTTQLAEAAAADGANIIVTTCDFDFAAPAAVVAQANGIPAISLCASDRKHADLTTIGDLAFSPSPGNFWKGSAAGQFAYEKGWRNAYVLTDDLLEYTKSLSDYFKGSFTDLGGAVVGEDIFTGNEQLDPSPNVTRLRSGAAGADVIVVPSVVPAATTMIKAIRDAGITTPILMPGAAVDGTLVTGSIPDISDFYSLPFACMPDYCEGEPNPKVIEFDAKFQERWGSPTVLAYPVLSYEMMYALKAAVEAAGSTEGTAIRDALQTLPPTDYLTGPISFSEICHNAQGRDMRVVEYQNGKGKFLQLIRPTVIAKTDPGNPCEAILG